MPAYSKSEFSCICVPMKICSLSDLCYCVSILTDSCSQTVIIQFWIMFSCLPTCYLLNIQIYMLNFFENLA